MDYNKILKMAKQFEKAAQVGQFISGENPVIQALRLRGWWQSNRGWGPEQIKQAQIINKMATDAGMQPRIMVEMYINKGKIPGYIVSYFGSGQPNNQVIKKIQYHLERNVSPQIIRIINSLDPKTLSKYKVGEYELDVLPISKRIWLNTNM